MSELAQLAEKALANPASQPAIELAKVWINWGDLRQLADHAAALPATSVVSPRAKIGLVARSHRSANATMIGLIARRYSIRMIYPFLPAAGIGREIDAVEPAVVDAETGAELTPHTENDPALYLREHVLATPIPVTWKMVTELPRTKLSFTVVQSAASQLLTRANNNTTNTTGCC